MSNNNAFDILSFSAESDSAQHQHPPQQQNGLADVTVEEATFDPFTINEDGTVPDRGFNFPQSFALPHDGTFGTYVAAPISTPEAPNLHAQPELIGTPLSTYGPQFPFPGYSDHGVGPMLGQGNTTPSNSSADELSHSFTPPCFAQADQWNPFLPVESAAPAPVPDFSHSTTPSYGSLASVITAPPPNQGPAVVGIFGRALGEDGLSCHSSGPISRHSSMSSLASLVKPPIEYTAQTMTTTHPISQGKMTRVRSNSRMTPYVRHGRSDSLSSAMSTTTNGWWNPSSGLESPLTNMSLGQSNRSTIQHRRSQSKSSGNHSAIAFGLAAVKSHSMDISSDVSLPSYLSLDERSAAVDQSLSALAVRAKTMQSSNVAQHDKARSHWVRQWLRLSYSRDPDLGSQYEVSRKAMFASYEQASKLYGVKAINSASFGKAVKNAHPGIKNRRLGRRHHSHYHYIALKPTTIVEVERLNAHGVRLGEARGLWSANVRAGTIHFRLFPSSTTEPQSEPELEEEEDDDDEAELEEGDTVMSFKRTASMTSLNKSYTGLSTDSYYRPSMARRHTTSTLPISLPSAEANMVPPTYTPVPNVRELDGFPSFDQVVFAIADIAGGQQAWEGLRQHLQSLVDCSSAGQFYQFEDLCRRYWSSLMSPIVDAWERPTMSWIIKTALAVTFDHIVATLVNGASSLSASGQEDLRELAESLEETMEECWSYYKADFTSDKLDIVCRTAHTLHRVGAFVDWNNKLSSVLAQPAQSRQLLSALDSLDVQHIADQHIMFMSPSCNWSYELVHQYIGGLRHALGRHASPVELAQWVDDFIKSTEGEIGSPSSMASGLATITSEIVRGVLQRPEMNGHSQVQLLKLWLDEYVTIWQHRQSILSVGGVNRLMTEFTPLSIGVPIPHLASEGDLNTAVPPPSQNAFAASAHQQPGGHDGSLHLLANAYEIDSMITPRQNLSMSDLIEPKPEPDVSQ